MQDRGDIIRLFFFIIENIPLILFQNECTPATCTQMTATEQWIFLCAAHKTPKEVSMGRKIYIFYDGHYDYDNDYDLEVHTPHFEYDYEHDYNTV